MPGDDFHARPFDEGTLTKLKIFELYAKGWFPVFLSRDRPARTEIHVFDFFAGPGVDSNDVPGSPLRLLRQLRSCQALPGWSKVGIHVHFFDESKRKIERLKTRINTQKLNLPNVSYDIRPLLFEDAFQESADELAKPGAAKLVFIDQSGVSQVTPEVFRNLVSSPTCDFLFFISSSTLNRFGKHPAIRQRINRPNDHYQVHRAVLDYYKSLLPPNQTYFLAPFSIKKGANIYGLIFGSAHPLGMDKFLQVAWRSDQITGEADFAINRENIRPGMLLLPLEEVRPSKIRAFERELEYLLRNGRLTDELQVIQLCFEYGVLRQHTTPVLKKLKREGIIELSFRVPDVRRFESPRPIRRKG